MAHYQKVRAEEFAKKVTKFGFKVYMAESGTYGIITDDKEDRVLYFQMTFGSLNLSGTYKANRYCGTGWQITDDLGQYFDKEYIKECLYMLAPRWVTTEPMKYSTLEEHLESYQASSKYKLFELKGAE